MDLRQIEAFLAVMSTGSMTRAAQLLSRSQPAVTRQIQELEQDLGFALFQRNGPKLLPTARAHALHGEAEHTLHASQRLQARARDLLRGRQGRLQLAAIPTLAAALIPQALARLPAGLKPDSVQLNSLTPDQVVQAVLSQAMQLGLVNLPLDYRGLDVQWLGEAACVAVLPADSPLAALPVVPLVRLGEQPLITHIATARLRLRIDAALARVDTELRPAIETNNSLSTIELVRAGLGVALLEPFTARSLQLKGVVTRPLDVHIPFYFGLIAPHGVPRSDTVSALVETLDARTRELLPDFIRHPPSACADLV